MTKHRCVKCDMMLGFLTALGASYLVMLFFGLVDFLSIGWNFVGQIAVFVLFSTLIYRRMDVSPVFSKSLVFSVGFVIGVRVVLFLV